MNGKLKFTVGMAVWDNDECRTEATRTKFTVMSLLTQHPLVGEVVVVDNTPKPVQPLYALAAKTGGRMKYLHAPVPQGTSAPRNKVFEAATLPHVVCIDSHVLLYPNFFELLSDFYLAQGVDCPDVVHGSMMTEANSLMATHMNAQWRSEMWGTWAVGHVSAVGKMFSCLTKDDQTVTFVSLDDGVNEQHELTPEEIDFMRLPRQLGWAGHERVLAAQYGCRPPSLPFTVPGHGMGVFACRKDSWLPFHENCRGFGGEELTTGVRFRKAGRRAWSVPFAMWWHDFDRPRTGGSYRLSNWDKARNYLIEFRRMGLDPAPMAEHFIATGAMAPADWEAMQRGCNWPSAPNSAPRPADYPPDEPPYATAAQPEVVRPPGGACGDRKVAATEAVELAYKEALSLAGAASPAMPVLRSLALSVRQGGGRVVELGTRDAAGTLALLAGYPKSLTTFDRGVNGRAAVLSYLVTPGATFEAKAAKPGEEDVPECELLVIDTSPHTGQHFWNELTRLHKKVTQFVAVRRAVSYGENSEGQPGVMHAARSFLDTFPQDWFVSRFDRNEDLLVLARSGAVERPAPPIDVSAPSAGAGAVAPPSVPENGPGTELKAILASLGVTETQGCPCKTRMTQMNAWGVQGCRENFSTIVGWMKDGQGNWGWADKLTAAALAVRTGLAFRLNPFDPFPSLVEEALRRAEAKETTVVAP